MFYSFNCFTNPFMMNSFFMPGFSFNFFTPCVFTPCIFQPFIYPSIFYPQYNMPSREERRAERQEAREARKQRRAERKAEKQKLNTPPNIPIQNLSTNKSVTNPKPVTNTENITKTQNINVMIPTIKTDPTIQTEPIPRIVTTQNNKDLLGKEFLKRLKEVAKEINCNYKDLLAVLNSESSLNPKAVNKQSGAAGLLQFMPSTAKDLGTSTEEILNMSPIEQLDYVEKYFKKHKKIGGFKENEKLKAEDLYALTFLPARAKRDILTDISEKYYKPNKGLDINNDGKITKNDLAVRMESKKVNESIFT